MLLVTQSIAYAEIKEITLPTKTDGDIKYLFDTNTRLPISAFDQKAKIMAVSLAFLPKEPNTPLFWAFTFEIKFQDNAIPTSIVIEDERENQSMQIEVSDQKPILTSSTWTATSKPVQMNDFWFKQMTGKTPWFLQYRFIVNYSDGSSSKLHQIAIVTNPTRFRLLEKIIGRSISEPSKP